MTNPAEQPDPDEYLVVCPICQERLKRMTASHVRKHDMTLDEFRASYRISGEVVEGSEISRLTFRTELERDGRAHTQLVKQYG